MIRWLFSFSNTDEKVETYVNTQEEDQAIANAVDSADEFVYLRVPGKIAYVRLSAVKMIIREEVDEKALAERLSQQTESKVEATPA